MEEMEEYIKLHAFVFIQLLSICYVIYFRPFDCPKENIIEIFNDLMFLGLSLIIMLITEKEYQSKFFSNLMIYLILASGAVSFITILASIALSVGKTVKR